MKKLLFTALAVVAFSGSLIANNDVETEVLNEDNLAFLFTNCETWAMDQMALYPVDQSPVDDHNDYRALVELCDSH